MTRAQGWATRRWRMQSASGTLIGLVSILCALVGVERQAAAFPAPRESARITPQVQEEDPKESEDPKDEEQEEESAEEQQEPAPQPQTPPDPNRPDPENPEPTPAEPQKDVKGKVRPPDAVPEKQPQGGPVPAGGEGSGEVKIDPQVQKQIDEMFRNRTGGRAQSANTPGAAPADPREIARQRAEERRRQREEARQRAAAGQSDTPAQPIPEPIVPARPRIEDIGAEQPPPGPSTPINIEPAQEPDPIPLEEGVYGFSIKNGTYEQLIRGFARQTGLGVMGEAPQGTVTFETTQKLTFREALGRIRMLLFNYKPHEPYWLLHEKGHFQVIRVNDLYRIIDRNRVFQNLKEYHAAGLPSDEIALVFFTPSGSIADLAAVRDFLPDYVRVTPVADQNRVAIFALVQDIERYLQFIDVVAGKGADPRVLERIEIKNITPTDAVNKLNQLMLLDGTGRMPMRTPRGREPSPLDGIPEPPIVMIPDDNLGFIAVRAMQSKIDEIKLLLPLIDVDLASPTPPPVVVRLEHAKATDVIPVLQQILSSSPTTSSSTGTSPTRRSSRRRRDAAVPTVGGAVTASGDTITLIPHPSDNAIIVLAPSETEIADVRNLVKMLDVQTKLEWVRIPLQNADAATVQETVQEILTASVGIRTDASAPTFQLFSDPMGDALWFSGTEQELARVQALVARLDVASEPVLFHSIRLTFQQPTFIANMLREFEGSGAPTAAVPAVEKSVSRRGAPRTGRRRAAAPASASKFTPDDASRTLYVLCTDSEWALYLPMIQQLDQPANQGQAPFSRIPLEHADPETVIDRLSTLIGQPGPEMGLASSIRLIPSEQSIIVVGATDSEIERIKLFLPEADKPAGIERRTFVIQHADPVEIKSAIEALIVGRSSEVVRRRPRINPQEGPAAVTAGESMVSSDMTIVQLGNKLIVSATANKLEEVEKLIAEFDVESAGAREIRVFADFPRGTDIVGISETIQTALSGSPLDRARTARGLKEGGGTASQEPRFIPQPSLGRLVVIASPEIFPEVERLINVLKYDVTTAPPIVVFIEVRHADPEELVEIIEPLLEIKIRGLLSTGELEEPLVEEGSPAGVAAVRGGRRGAMGRSQSGNRYQLVPDLRNNRIVVAAPDVVVEQVRELVTKFDLPGVKDEMIIKTVELKHADPGEMIKAVKEMIGRPTVRRTDRGRRGAAAAPVSVAQPGQAGTTAEGATGESLTLVEAPGGDAIVVRGLRIDVEQAVEWINMLDSMSAAGRQIKMYDIKRTDTAKLFDLIVNVVDSGARAAAKPISAVPRPSRGNSAEDESEGFVTSKTHNGADIYIHADLIASTIVVSASPKKITQIDDIVLQIDGSDEQPPEVIVLPEEKAIPRRMFALRYVDSVDAALALEEVLEKLWDPPDELPKVESFSFGDYIIVRYPHEDRFSEVEKFLRDLVDVPDEEELRRVKRSRTPPAGFTPSQAAAWLKLNLPDVDVEVKDESPERIETYGVKELGPNVRGGGHPCVLPESLIRAAAWWGAGMAAQTQESPEPEEDTDQELPPDELDDELPEEEVPQDDPIINSQDWQPTADQLLQQGAASGPPPASRTPDAKSDVSTESSGRRKSYEGEKVIIRYDDSKGVMVIEGPDGVFSEIDTLLDELKEESDDFPEELDIRIVRVRYIDVYSAQDIIEEMFNVTKQQQAQLRAIQQQQLQAQRQQQLAQERAQQRGRQQSGEPAAEGPGGREAVEQVRGRQQMQQVAMPQLPPTTVRVYPNPRDRTLILRADTSTYPQIYKLLATIDQPKPIDSFMRTFPLKKLNAKEVETVLREMLNLDEGGGSRRARRGGEEGMATTGPGSQLPQTILQSVVGAEDELALDPEHIKLFASETGNTIMAMAPTAALDFIAKVIENLESGDIPDRITKYYELKHASAEEVVDYLGTHFAEGGRSGAAKRTDPGAITGGAPNSPTFIAYARLNMITAQATQTQLDEVDSIVAKLDVGSAEDEWKDLRVAHVDAALAADVLTKMFGVGGSGRAMGPGVRGGSGAETGPKFIAQEGGGIILFSAPASLHDKIRETVAKLEEQYQDTQTPRIIELQHGTPSVIAEALTQAYSPKGGGRRGAAATARFSVTPHDPSKRLFVMADDKTFAEIDSLVKTLDVAGELPEFRIYTLQYASATEVHGFLTKLMGEYLQRLGPKAGVTEAFSVQADPVSNSLIVLGGPVVFGFLEENLRKVDTPISQGQSDVRVVDLKHAEPEAVAKTLNEIYVRGGGQGRGGQPPDITITALAGSKAVLIKAKDADYERIAETIAQLDTEDVTTGGEVRVVTLLFADAAEISAAMQEYLRKTGSGRGGQLAGDVRLSVLGQSNALMVAGAKEEVDRLEGIIRGMDIAGEKGSVPLIIPVKFANASMLVGALKEMFTDARGSGKKNYAPPVIVADETGNNIIVRAAPTDMAAIEELIAKLDTEDKKDQTPFKLIKLPAGVNVGEMAELVEGTINESARARAGTARGTQVPSIRVTPENRTNSLTMSGSATLFAEAESLVNQLVEMGPPGGRSTRIITARRVEVGDIQRLIDQLTQGSSDGGGPRRSSGSRRSSPSRPTRQP